MLGSPALSGLFMPYLPPLYPLSGTRREHNRVAAQHAYDRKGKWNFVSSGRRTPAPDAHQCVSTACPQSSRRMLDEACDDFEATGLLIRASWAP
jgi:hypothetical protein